MFRFKLSSLLLLMTLFSFYVALLHNQSSETVCIVIFLSLSAFILPGFILHLLVICGMAVYDAAQQRSIIPLVKRAQLVVVDAVWIIWLLVCISTIHYVFEFAEPTIRMSLAGILVVGCLASLIGYASIYRTKVVPS